MPIVDRNILTTNSVARVIRFDNRVNASRWDNIDAKIDAFNINTPPMKRIDVRAFYDIITDVCDGRELTD